MHQYLAGPTPKCNHIIGTNSERLSNIIIPPPSSLLKSPCQNSGFFHRCLYHVLCSHIDAAVCHFIPEKCWGWVERGRSWQSLSLPALLLYHSARECHSILPLEWSCTISPSTSPHLNSYSIENEERGFILSKNIPMKRVLSNFTD